MLRFVLLKLVTCPYIFLLFSLAYTHRFILLHSELTLFVIYPFPYLNIFPLSKSSHRYALKLFCLFIWIFFFLEMFYQYTFGWGENEASFIYLNFQKYWSAFDFYMLTFRELTGQHKSTLKLFLMLSGTSR